MTDRDHDIDRMPEEALDGFFEAARETPARPDDAFLARMTAEALAVQAGFAAEAGAGAGAGLARRRSGLLGEVLSGLRGLGGWPAMAGLASAAVAGIWLGFSPALGVGDAVTAALEGDSSYVIDYGASYTLALYDGESQ